MKPDHTHELWYVLRQAVSVEDDKCFTWYSQLNAKSEKKKRNMKP